MFEKISKETVISVYKPVEFPVVDHDELALELDIETLSKQAARENKPLSNSTSPDANELKFKEDLSRRAFQSGNRVNQSLSDLQDAIFNTSIAEEVSEIESMSNTFESQISAGLQSKLSHLKSMEDDYRQLNDDINHFKKTNSLRRTACYPESHILTFALLILALLLESSLNGIFFAEGSDAGLIGGVVTALGISFINILFGFSMGLFVLRYKNHVVRIKAILSYLVITLAVTCSMAFNLLIGHYREALTNNPDDAHSVAVENFSNGIMTIYDVQSWFLISIGLIFFGLAIYKGYKFDDEYPQYGKFARNREQLKDDIISEKQDFYDEFDNLHDEFDSKLDDIFDDVKMKSKRLNSYVSTIENQESIYRSYTVHLQNCLAYVIQLYRDINTNERDEAAPKYFDEMNMKIDLNEGLSVEIMDKRKDFIDKKDQLAGSIPKIKSELFSIKERYHSQINEACKL